METPWKQLLQEEKMPETRHYCPHCEETVSLSTPHRHKQLYYDERQRNWMKSEECAEIVSSDSCAEDGDFNDDDPIGFDDVVEGTYHNS